VEGVFGVWGCVVTREQLAEVLAYVEGAWGRPVTDTTAAVWWSEFQHHDQELVLEAVRALAHTGREFPPSVGQVGREARSRWRPSALQVERHLAEVGRRLERPTRGVLPRRGGMREVVDALRPDGDAA
jgi:hypothetical protein